MVWLSNVKSLWWFSFIPLDNTLTNFFYKMAWVHDENHLSERVFVMGCNHSCWKGVCLREMQFLRAHDYYLNHPCTSKYVWNPFIQCIYTFPCCDKNISRCCLCIGVICKGPAEASYAMKNVLYYMVCQFTFKFSFSYMVHQHTFRFTVNQSMKASNLPLINYLKVLLYGHFIKK